MKKNIKFTYKYYLIPLIGVLVYLFLLSSCNKEREGYKYVSKIYPLLDTENSRWFFFSSASRPFGMVNLSPDTQIKGDWGGGYRYDIDTVKGFSHIHAWQLAGPSIMPISIDKSSSKNIFSDYFSKFNHKDEIIFPGYHKIYLERYNIKAEITSTKRVGFHRYTSKKQIAMLFNLNGLLGPSIMSNDIIKTESNNRTITGEITNLPTTRRPKPCTVYFVASFNTDIKEIKKDDISGNYLVHFNKKNRNPLMMKLAISYTSIDNAKINLNQELPNWDFDSIVEDSQKEWDSLLSRIDVEGGTLEQQQRFYTDLWHALQGRRTINDVNGAYPNNTGKNFEIGQIPLDEKEKPIFNHYNSDSFWGAQWTISTLWALAYPEITADFVNSLMQYYKDGGMIPRGPSGGNYTYVMTGASSNPFIISAIQKGIITDSLEFIYQALKKNQMPGGIMGKAGYEHMSNIGGGLNYYIKNGYVPYPLTDTIYGSHQDGAGQTLEYAYQDWALAQLAIKMGKTDDSEHFLSRSNNYKNVFDEVSGWMRPKDKNGLWKQDFDPYLIDNGFVEANGAQSTWFVPHDIKGLAKIMGGIEKASTKLNEIFEDAEKMGFTAGTSHARETHPEYSRIPINYGNQPSIHTANIFNHLEKPWLTQYWSRRVIETVYEGISPSLGYCGDEDQGLMGALSVLMKIGLFEMDGGCAINPMLEIGSPIFDKITINLNQNFYSGKEFVIETINNSSKNYYIESIIWNDKEYNSWQIPFNEVVSGGKLILNMSSTPNE